MRTLLAEPCPPELSSTPKIGRPRLGFLGVGWIGRHRLEALAASGAVEIAAIADPSRELREPILQTQPQATAVESLDHLLELELDGVVIATPSALHAEQAIVALENGLPVFCQKPLGRTAGETRRVIEAARSADLLLGVDLSYRFISAARSVHDLCRSGELGEIYAADLVFHNAYGPDKPWFYDWRLSGGGCVIDLGIHLVDLALWNLNFPRVTEVAGRLFAGGKPIAGRSQSVEDYATARLDLDSGATVQLACSWKLPAGCDAVISATFYGTKGGATFHNVNGSFYDFAAERFHGTRREVLSDSAESWGGRAAVDWAQRLASDGRFNPNIDELVQVAESLDRIYQNSGK